MVNGKTVNLQEVSESVHDKSFQQLGYIRILYIKAQSSQNPPVLAGMIYYLYLLYIIANWKYLDCRQNKHLKDIVHRQLIDMYYIKDIKFPHNAYEQLPF